MSKVLGVGLCGNRDEKRVLCQSESVSTQRSEKERTHNSKGRLVLDEYAASGLNIREFCKRESLSEPSFYGWRRKIHARDNGKPSQSKRARKTDTKNKSSKQIAPFLPVNIVETASDDSIEIIASDNILIRLRANCQTETLVRVLNALRQGEASC